MKRKYLDDINVTERPDLWNQDDSRQEYWAKDREEYGFDERDTWSMDIAFYCWLYEHLKMYVDYAGVNLDYHKFEYNGKEYTQQQMINMMLERLEFSFKKDYNHFDDKQWEYVHEIEKLWAIVCPAMWW